MLIDGYWLAVRDGDLRGLGLYLRHYSSKKGRAGYTVTPIGNRARFVGSGDHVVLMTQDCRALFAWRVQQYRGDDQRGVECTIFFRKEGQGLASDMIAEACDIAWRRWPGQRLFTFVNPSEVRSPNPGYCFKRAGFRFCGRSQRGLHVLELLPAIALEAAA